MDIQTATLEAPTPPVASTRAHYEAEEALLRPEPTDAPAAPVVEAPAPAESATPEQEAESAKPDDAVSEAARTLRKNRSDERKAQIQREIDDLVKERNLLRTETQRLREHQPPAIAPAPATPAAAVKATADPEPREADFSDDPNPYAYLDARARWVARAELAQREAASSVRVTQEHTATELAAKEAKGRAKFTDFDAVIDPFVQAFATDPRGPAILEYIQRPDVSEDFVYALAKDEATQRAIKSAATPLDVLRALARAETRLLETAKPPSKPLTQVPPPPAQTVGAHASGTVTRTATDTRSHYEIEQAEIEARQSRGLRY